MRGLNGLKLWDVFLLFASVAIGVVLKGELAVLFLDFFARGRSGEL